jgi:hypothetical protein
MPRRKNTVMTLSNLERYERIAWARTCDKQRVIPKPRPDALDALTGPQLVSFNVRPHFQAAWY